MKEKPTNGSVTLKPCPFCGCAPRLLSDGGSHSVLCSACGAETEIDLPLPEAIARWNRRANSEFDLRASSTSDSSVLKYLRIYIPSKQKHFFSEEYAKTHQSIRVAFDMPLELYRVLCKYAIGHKNHPDDAARLIVMRDCCLYVDRIDVEPSKEVSSDA